MRWLKIMIIMLLTFTTNIKAGSSTGNQFFIPMVSNNVSPLPAQRTVNAPFFNVADLNSKLNEMAILWFGKVNLDDNYTDVRIGYNASEILIRAQIFDRRLWYNPTPATSPFEDWDSLAVTINLDNNASTLSQQSYRFIGQLYWWEGSTNFKKAYQGNVSGWTEKPLFFNADMGWRGNAPLDNIDDRGWVITFHIPFSTLGLSTNPTTGTAMRLGFALYDRDSSASPALAPKTWPENYNSLKPSTWGSLKFGLATYSSPNIINKQTTVIREGLNGNYVPDSQVGGSSICGSGLDFWTQWGDANYKGSTFFNVQNQSDVADWPCYSKHYVTFPISSIPLGKEIQFAKLSMHQFGNADPTQAYPSLIQVLTVNEDWDETTITWNNAPLAYENISQTWVDVIKTSVPWPGVEYTWDVSRAVNQAYQTGKPVRLVLYSADTAYHSGKYFTTSEAGDWDAIGRPSLFVDWGDSQFQ